jgi:hypothetical protein
MKSGMQLDKLMREMKRGDHLVTLLIRYAMSRLARPVYSSGALWYPPLQRRCTVLIRSAHAAAQLVLRTQAERKAAPAAQSAVVKGLPLWSPK